MDSTHPVFPSLRFAPVLEQAIPDFHLVRVRQPEQAAVPDLDEAVARALAGSSELRALRPGASVAVAVGSRGIAQLSRIVARVVAGLRGMGHRPFIVPSMGSHGGGTAEGQAALLAKLGVDKAGVGAPVRATMDTVNLGPVAPGVDCHLDRHAAEADGIVIVARVKQHTSFDAPIESGLCKMVAVGLGKAQGARNVHVYGRSGLVELMPQIAERSLRNSRFLLGVAVVENAHKEVALLEGVAPGDFAAADQRLLALANSFTPRLPFDQLDLLVVQEIGKDISGTGMDNKVVGRQGFRNDPPRRPFINCTVALRLTPASRGNGIGVGNAEIITRELANGLDLQAMYFNALTSACVARACIPPVLDTELDAVKAGLAICWQPDPARVRACVIKSTAALDRMLVTRPLVDELLVTGACLEQAGSAPLEFTPEGRFLSSL